MDADMPSVRATTRATAMHATDLLQESLRPFIAPADRPQGLSPDEATALIEDYQVPALILERLTARMTAMLDAGVERRELVATVQQLLDVLDGCVRAFQDARTKSNSFSSSLVRDRLAGISAVIKQASEMREWLAGILRWLDGQVPRSAPPLPPAVQAGPGAAGYIGLDDFMTRLRAGA
jgi:hypothetical protein